jgi:hypothetical protein
VEPLLPPRRAGLSEGGSHEAEIVSGWETSRSSDGLPAAGAAGCTAAGGGGAEGTEHPGAKWTAEERCRGLKRQRHEWSAG